MKFKLLTTQKILTVCLALFLPAIAIILIYSGYQANLARDTTKIILTNKILLSAILVLLISSCIFILKIRTDFFAKKNLATALAKLHEEQELKIKARTGELDGREKLFRALVENNQGIISLVDENLHVIYRSSSAARITGWLHEEYEKTPATKFIHPDDIDYVKTVMNEAVTNPGKTISQTMRVRHKNGHYIWLDGVITNLKHDPNIRGMVINLIDVTAQKEAEQKIIKANRLFFFISQINQMLVKVNDEETLFKEACRIAVDIGKFRMAWIGLLDEKTKRLLPVTHAGEEQDYLSKISIMSVGDAPEGRGPSGKALREGKYIVCNDIAQTPEMAPWREAALERNYHSSIGLPIKKWGKVVGVFSVYADTKNFFDAEQIRLLDEISGDISFSLEIFEKEKLRKKAEEELLKSELRYQTLTETSPVGIFHTDASGYTTYVNPSWCRISGMPGQDALGNGWLKAVHPKDMEALMRGWQEATKSQQLSLSEYRFVRPDVSIAWVIGQAIPERNAENQIVGYVGTITDITERKKAEEAIINNEKKFKALIENSTDGLTVIAADGTVLDMSPFGKKILGYEKEEIAGKLHPDLLHPDDKEKVLNAFADILDNPSVIRTIEYRHKMPDGSYKWLECSLNNLLQEPYLNAVVLNFRDITEKKIAALLLKESEEKYRKAQAMGKMGHWELDLKTDELLWSDEIYQIFDIDKNAFPVDHESFIKSIHTEDRDAFHKAQEKTLAGKNKLDFIYRIARKDGAIRYVHEIGELVRNASGDAVVLTGTVQDITGQVIAQNEIIKERNLSDSIINSLPGVFYLYDKNGTILRWNRNLENVTKYTANEISQMHPLDFFDDDEKEFIEKKIANTFYYGEENAQANFLLKTKEKIPYYFTGKAIEYEGTPCVMGVGVDFSERLKAQEEIKQTSQKLRQLAAYLQNIREEERKRIGREIHDELGQQITAIKMDVAWIDKKIPKGELLLKNKLRNTIELLDGGNQSIRRILSELRPAILDEYGLVEALQLRIKKFTLNTGIRVEFVTNEAHVKLNEQLSTCIYRVCQEALTNITRYAQADKVFISLNFIDDKIIFTIKDNGKGFDTDSLQNINSYGILGMRERVLSLAGKFELISSPGEGTKIVFILPCNIAIKT